MTAPESGHRLPWHPRSRMARLRASHSYRFVLVLIVASFLFTAAAPSETWVASVLVLIQSVTLAVALWTSGLGRDHSAGITVLAIGVALAIAQLVTGGETLEGAIGLLNMVLVVAVMAVIGVGVLDQGEVNQQSVSGAICIYLEIGMLFTFVYSAMAALDSGSFFAQGTDGTPGLRLYFSYVTLATLGYGDYTAAGTLGHTLSVVEALLGQLYLVTVVALLVGMVGRRRRAR